MLKITTATHELFFPQRVNNICYFNLNVCYKTLEGMADLEEPLIFHLFHSK